MFLVIITKIWLTNESQNGRREFSFICDILTWSNEIKLKSNEKTVQLPFSSSLMCHDIFNLHIGRLKFLSYDAMDACPVK